MKASDVHVAIAVDSVVEALINRLGVRKGGKHRRNSLGDGRVLLEKVDDALLDGLRRLGLDDQLLRRRSIVSRVQQSHAGGTTTVRGASIEWGGRSRLVGRVRAPAGLEARNLARAAAVVVSSNGAAGGVWDRLVGDRTLCKVAMHGILAGNAVSISAVRGHTNMNRDRVALVGHSLLRVRMSRNLSRSHASIARSIVSGESQVSELVDDCSDTVIADRGVNLASGKSNILMLDGMGIRSTVVMVSRSGAMNIGEIIGVTIVANVGRHAGSRMIRHGEVVSA